MPAPAYHPIRYIEALRLEVRALEKIGQANVAGCLPFGIEAIDRQLLSGGLSLAALHEATGATPSLNDHAAAILFIAGIASRRASDSGTVLWALGRTDLFAPALAQVGLTSQRLIQAECGRDDEVLAVMEEGLRHGGLAAVVGEIGRASMTATRRLQLAAENSGTTALLLKRWRRSVEDPIATPTVAMTRWRIGCVPSEALPVAGIGRPRWRVELVRQRGGEPHQWIVEGSDAEGRLALAAEPAYRSTAAGEVRHAA